MDEAGQAPAQAAPLEYAHAPEHMLEPDTPILGRERIAGEVDPFLGHALNPMHHDLPLTLEGSDLPDV